MGKPRFNAAVAEILSIRQEPHQVIPRQQSEWIDGIN